MSVQTQIDRIIGVRDQQTSLIAQIKTALDGKVSPASQAPDIKTTKPNSNSTSISFTGLTAQPRMFAICPTGDITLGTTRFVTGVMYDGSTTHGTCGYRSNTSGASSSYYSNSYFTWTYSNGTLTVRTSSATNGGNFTSSVTYQLTYIV